MFSRRRRFYEKKSFYAAVVAAFIAVCSLSLWMGGEPEETSKERGTDALREELRIQSAQTLSQEKGEAPSERKDDEGIVSEEPDIAVSGAEVLDRPLNEGYFVIEEDGYIRIYQVNETGEKTALRTSEIRFDLLGKEDQEMFRLGVELKDEEQLMELLQDFES